MRPIARLVILLSVLLVAVPGTPSADAKTTGALEVFDEIFIDAHTDIFDEQNDLIGHRMAHLFVQVRRGAELAGTGPSASARATGYVHSFFFDEGTHQSLGFPWQDVLDTAVVGDPAGNSLTFAASLFEDPDAQTGSHVFDITLEKPTGTHLEHPDTHNPGINAWASSSGEAGANANLRTGVRRSGYTVEGVFAGEPFTSGPGTFASTFHGLVGTPSVSVP